MLSSPFQQPSPRQNVLLSQIQDVQRCGDERQLALLLGQWVHRFGIDSLPVTHGSCSEAITDALDQLLLVLAERVLLLHEALGVLRPLAAHEQGGRRAAARRRAVACARSLWGTGPGACPAPGPAGAASRRGRRRADYVHGLLAEACPRGAPADQRRRATRSRTPAVVNVTA